MSRIISLSLLLVCSTSFAADILTPQAQALIAPVHEAFERLRRRQAELPPPKNDSELLIRLGQTDQVGRVAKGKVDLSSLAPEQRAAAFAVINREINAHDRANDAALEAIIPAGGWFPVSRYGPDAAEAAFQIVQHSVNDVGLPEYDKGLQHRVLAAMERLLGKGEVNRQDYALLHDRVHIFDGQPQLYGTQMKCRGGKWVLDQVADPDRVNERRKDMGFELTVEQNVARFANLPPCS